MAENYNWPSQRARVRARVSNIFQPKTDTPTTVKLNGPIDMVLQSKGIARKWKSPKTLTFSVLSAA